MSTGGRMLVMMMAPDQLEEDLGVDKDLESKKKKMN